MTTRFKNNQLQDQYEFLMKNPPFTPVKHGKFFCGGSIREGFLNGYKGIAFNRVVRGSFVHAAWAAGQDTRKAESK